MARLEVLGATGGEVTGSGNLVTLGNGKQILVDYGLFQGSKRNERRSKNLDVNPADLSAIAITHAHAE